MADTKENARLRAHVEQLAAENTSLREESFRGSKAEALMALEYDRIPNVLKTPRAIVLQRKIATAVLIIVPLLIITIAIVGGISAYRDHQRSLDVQKGWADLGNSVEDTVKKTLPH